MCNKKEVDYLTRKYKKIIKQSVDDWAITNDEILDDYKDEQNGKIKS